MITFTIKYNETENKADMKDTDSMLDLKKLIIENLSLDTEYIDLDFKIERPIRGLGKMNLEKVFYQELWIIFHLTDII